MSTFIEVRRLRRLQGRPPDETAALRQLIQVRHIAIVQPAGTGTEIFMGESEDPLMVEDSYASVTAAIAAAAQIITMPRVAP